jgi:hypothetical protein
MIKDFLAADFLCALEGALFSEIWGGDIFSLTL